MVGAYLLESILVTLLYWAVFGGVAAVFSRRGRRKRNAIAALPWAMAIGSTRIARGFGLDGEFMFVAIVPAVLLGIVISRHLRGAVTVQ